MRLLELLLSSGSTTPSAPNIDKRITENKDLLQIYQQLKKAWGNPPSYHDVMWAYLNKDKLINAKNRDWGLYRNDIHQMADLLEREGKLLESLCLYFEVNDLDINGCSNTGGDDLTEVERKKYGIKDFDPRDSFLAPGMIYITMDMIDKLSLSEANAKKLYLETIEKVRVGLPMPFTIEESWNKLITEIKAHKDKQALVTSFDYSDIDKLVDQIHKNYDKYDDTVYQLMNKFKNQFRKKQLLIEGKNNIERVVNELLESKKDKNNRIGENLLIYFAKRDNYLFQELLLTHINRIRKRNRSWKHDPFVNRSISLIKNPS